MDKPEIAPYGSWVSPITADLIVSRSVVLGQIELDQENIYWIEGRPQEGGRYVLVQYSSQGQMVDLTPPQFNVRTRVHEYGGGAFVVSEGTIFFSNFDDQRLYRQDPGGEPHPLTPAVDLRYADAAVDRPRSRLICVREDHTGSGEAVNTLVSLDMEQGGVGQVIVSGNNFYASPRLNPDGTRLCWLTWNHPNMPWDGCELWVADVNADGSLGKSQKVAGGPEESIFQPEWSPDGTLYFVSDRSGWWNLYRRVDGRDEALAPMEAEFGTPHWNFAMYMYAFASARHLICIYTKDGKPHLARLDTQTLELEHLQTGYPDMFRVRADAEKAVFLAADVKTPWSVVRLDLNTKKIDVLRRAREIDFNPEYFSIPQAIEFPTENGLAAHGFYYPPHNPDFGAGTGELPPLVVKSHGGPTGSTSTAFRIDIAFLTSRGLAVLDVDYGGSSGYGREYRERLKGQWGVVDVDDCANGALYLAQQGLVDRERMAITGGSAGGYTTLCALAFKDIFKAGASHFGIGDLEIFVNDTHKFESRYLDSLIGPHPERLDLYKERSPINYTDQLNCAMILFQGMEDKIVPPNQAETMYAAVKAKGLPVAYLPFEGEQHGFRRAENIKRSLEAELYFYGKVFGFQPADKIEPVEIENLS